MKMRAFAILAAVFLLGACQGRNAQSYLDSAQSYLAKRDYKAATIEAKNALQVEPENVRARLVLARAMLAGGDAIGAEIEVRKAIDAHAADDDAYPLLGEALVAQGKHEKAIKELSSRHFESTEARVQAGTALANAHAAQGDLAGAGRDVDAVLAEKPHDVDALLLKAQLAGAGGNVGEAEKYVDLALKESPKSVPALMTKANVALARHRVDDAQKLMEQAVDAAPEAIGPRAALVSLAASTGKLDVAKAQAAKMKEIAARDMHTIYAEGLVAYMEGDNGRARDAMQRLLATRSDYLPAMLLSGLAEMRLGAYASAEDKLRSVVQRAPGDPMARRGLALVYLRTGHPAEALQTVEAGRAQTPDDPTLLRLAGEAYLAMGKPSAAAAAYERANSLDKGNVASEVRLAQVRFATGDPARGFGELEALAAKDDSGTQAQLALFAAHLKRHEYDKALAVADALEKRQPNTALPFNLRGMVYLTSRDLTKARSNFEKALQVQPDFYPAVSNLATLDIQEGKLQAAQNRYAKLLEKNPKNELALIQSADLLELTGAPADEVRAALDKAVNANPASPNARVARIRFELRHNEPKAAVSAAQTAIAAMPKDPQVLTSLATAQLLNHDPNQAVETMRQVVALQPQNPVPLVQLAELQTSLKQYQDAIANEQKALALKPDLAAAWVALARTYLASGKPDQAVQEARRLQKEYPDKAFGYALEGEILIAQKKWPEAVTAFRAGLSRQPIPLIAGRLFSTLLAADKPQEARAMSEQWTKQHPTDATLLVLVAEDDQRKKDYASAVNGYKRVLAIDDDNIAALNNLAYILTEQGNREAVEYAEQAHRAAPLNPNVLDTLGWALTKTGDPKRGAQLLRMASVLAPSNNEIRLHLGRALFESGDKAAAKQVLADLGKLDKTSPLRAEAEKILAGQ